MRIRWKLFWLLAAISLVPLLLLRLNSHFALTRLAERLSTRVGDHLMGMTEVRLRRLVEDHARLLESRRQTLAVAVALQARAVAAALAATPPVPAPATIIATDKGMGMGMDFAPPPTNTAGLMERPGYFRVSPAGVPTPLPVNPDQVTLRLLPGTDRAAPLSDRAAALTGLVGPYRDIAGLVGPLAHFQITALADGLLTLYPSTAGALRRFNPLQAPWYLAGLNAAAPVWTPPQTEPCTERIAVAVSSRITNPDGSTAGVTAILTPLDDLLASVSMPSHFSGEVRSLLVLAAPDASGRLRVMIEAGEKRFVHGRGWHSFITPSPLVSPDMAPLDAMAEDIAKGLSGVRRFQYGGQDSLAAYARTADNEALLQIIPVDGVLAESRDVAGEVKNSINRLFFFGTAIMATVMLTLIVLSLTASRAVTRPILALTAAARKLSNGDFSARVPAPGQDEIGELGRVFNEIAPHLDAHMRLCETVALASEIQHSLLPANPPGLPGLSLAGASRYCDATGGDYYDFLVFPGEKTGTLGIALGDVSGHGLEAALLMTTARALLRPRAAGPGTPGDILADVNRELTRDTYGTGRFMTLFYLEIDRVAGTAAFARGGHDPALRYDPATGIMDEWTAKGLALGVIEDAVYATGSVSDLRPGQVILIGSDGLWEAENPAGEMFGKARTREILARSASGGAQAVLDALFATLDAFRGDRPLDDDVTLVTVAITDIP